MPVVNPGIRRFLGSAIQRLLNGAAFALPLTHTAIPERGDITPSFTRATTETGQKWDEAGYLDFTALAGEIVFKGARRERNLLATSSKDFSVTTGSSLNATPTAGSVVFTNASAYRYKRSLAIPGTKVQCSCLVKSSDGSKAVVGVRGYGVASGASAFESVALTTEYQQIVITISGATISEAIDFGLENRVGNGGDGTATGTVEIAEIQIHDITGETDQTTIRPYVSVGVESAPTYHGSMVDGVKCYDTDRNGNPISTSGSYPLIGYVPWEARTNLCIRSQEFDAWGVNTGGAGSLPVVTANAGVAPDGTTTADKVVFSAPGAGDFSQMYSPAFATVAASSYTAAVHVKAFAAGDVGKQLLIRHVGGVAYTTITLTAAWQRLGNTEVAAAASGEFDILLRPTFGGSSGTVSCYLWQADVQLGTFITPAIPTTTVAVARNADLLTYTGADVANIKTLACTFSRGVGVSGFGVETVLSDGTGNTYFGSYLSSATAQNFRGVSASVDQWIQTASNAYTPGATTKASTSAATNNVLMDFNGTAQTQDTVATVPTVNQINVGHLAGTLVLNGPVNHIYGWTRNLSQSELGAIDA